MNLCPNCFSSKATEQGRCSVCGFSESVYRDSRALPAGILLHNRYMVGRVLGMGGFGITYVAYDRLIQRRFAVKEYFPAEWAMRASPGKQIIQNSQTHESIYQRGREVFINEAKVLNRLRDVSGVVDVLDFFQENGTAYMVMELLDGPTLSGYMRRLGVQSLPWQEANRIILQAGLALQEVHRQMLLHRDIGPDNIMLSEDGRVHLIDFGATRIYALNSERSMSVILKPGFSPIEQYSRIGKQGPWTDVYALAATYYYLVTGTKPPEAPDRVGENALPKLGEDIPKHISHAIAHALQFHWKQRTEDVGKFLSEMKLCATPVAERISRNRSTKYYFDAGNTLTIGRNRKLSMVVLEDSQVSGLHCEIEYQQNTEQFLVKNYSGNRTYTSRGTLEKGESVYIQRGGWIYIQTARERFLFYMEVE